MPQIISDLAYILIIAGIVTIIFKKLRQPLVLGYIVAGFLAGPHMSYTPSVSDMKSIEEWSQLGVIFLMFTLGLEFSFKKIVNMGMKPIFAAVSVMVCMISVGSGVGYLFGWNGMDRLFLGGMLAMSSTTIIYKAFDDLGIRTKKFTSGVLSVLILEDILGILLMVILSAIAVSRSFEGKQLIESLLKLGFFLLLWFMVGIYLVPLFLRKYKKYINSETLLIVSVGLCFLLVVVAVKVGYSAAFGAFMMGSILAETMEAERIEHNVSSLRDLFGAIFFVSVGMLVEPSVLVQYWLPILVITLSVILGQMLFGSFSFFISGHSIRESIQSGFSLAQIGEFAFIIATLGQSLGVTSKFIYPVVVAVSIITTFFTPYMIKAAEPAYLYVEKILPNQFTNAFEKKKEKRKNTNKLYTLSTAWKSLLKAILWQTVAYLTLCVAIIGLSFASLLPLCRNTFTHWPGNIICGIITFLLIAPNVRPIVIRKNKSEEVKFIMKNGTIQKVLVWIMFLTRFFIGCNIIYYIINFLSPFWWFWHCLISVALMVFIMVNPRIKLISIKIERTFNKNLSSREDNSMPGYGRRLKGSDLHISSLILPVNSAWGGKTLAMLNIGRNDNIHIAAVVRGRTRINIPDGKTRLYPGDKLEVVGDDESTALFSQRINSEIYENQEENTNACLQLERFIIGSTSIFCEKTLAESGIRGDYKCTVIGLEDKQGNIHTVHSDGIIKQGDVLWIVGESSDLSMLKMVV